MYYQLVIVVDDSLGFFKHILGLLLLLPIIWSWGAS